MKFSMLIAKFDPAIVFVKSAAMNNGLHGMTIAPKKNPNRSALKKGFLTAGVWNFGRNLPMSILKISSILIIASIVNAIGDTIPITLFRESCKNVVNINPSKNINKITPKVMIIPNKAKDFFDSSPVSLLDKYAKKAGYNGRTQTAVRGVSNPRINDVNRFVSMLTI